MGNKFGIGSTKRWTCAALAAVAALVAGSIPAFGATKTNKRFESIGSGPYHACAIDSRSNAFCAGENRWAQLGVVGADSATPVAIPNLGNTKQIDGFANGTCALSRAGSVTCWGDNRFGFAGTGETESDQKSNRKPVLGVKNAIQIATGSPHACALLESQTVTCWGYNSDGQLGNGTKTITNATVAEDGVLGSFVPVVVTGITDAIQVDAGGLSTCALRKTGRIMCWGDNSQGQLGIATTTKSSTVPVEVPGIVDAKRIALGAFFGCAILYDSTVSCWGSNYFGPLALPEEVKVSPANVIPKTRGTSQISAGQYHVCISVTEGRVKCWGAHRQTKKRVNGLEMLIGKYGPPRLIPNVTRVRSLVAGEFFTCALSDTGTVKCWGENTYGPFGNGTNQRSEQPVNAFGS
jgi:alpha-tubulin suppressor-like RCC1 family protein